MPDVDSRLATQTEVKKRLCVVHRGYQAATSGRRKRIFSHSDLGYLKRERVAFDRLLELLEEAFRLCCSAAPNDRYRFVDARQVPRFGKRASKRLGQRQNDIIVVDVKRAFVLVLRRARQIETLFLN